MENNDWDLSAIVRSYKSSTFTAPPTTNFTPLIATTETPSPVTTNTPQNTTTLTFDLDDFFLDPENISCPIPRPKPDDFLELDQLLMEFNPMTFPIPTTTTDSSADGINPKSTFSDLSDLTGQPEIQHHDDLNHVVAPTIYIPIEPSNTSFDYGIFHPHQQQPQPQPTNPQQQQLEPYQLPIPIPQITSMALQNTLPKATKPKRRKSQRRQMKMECKVTHDKLFADSWAWRKYGQKPIKGSPHPRHYYKCNTCDGCDARKQIEKSNTDPNMFLVTYFGDHKHSKPAYQSPLSGTTRNKPRVTPLPTAKETGSSIIMERGSSSNPVCPPPIMLQFDSPENHDVNVGADKSKSHNMSMELGEDNYLIHNMGTMSNGYLLEFDPFYDCTNPSVGSGLNNNTSYIRFSSE